MFSRDQWIAKSRQFTCPEATHNPTFRRSHRVLQHEIRFLPSASDGGKRSWERRLVWTDAALRHLTTSFRLLYAGCWITEHNGTLYDLRASSSTPVSTAAGLLIFRCDSGHLLSSSQRQFSQCKHLFPSQQRKIRYYYTLKRI